MLLSEGWEEILGARSRGGGVRKSVGGSEELRVKAEGENLMAAAVGWRGWERREARGRERKVRVRLGCVSWCWMGGGLGDGDVPAG